mgnify:FL=1
MHTEKLEEKAPDLGTALGNLAAALLHECSMNDELLSVAGEMSVSREGGRVVEVPWLLCPAAMSGTFRSAFALRAPWRA